jgi:hypothetical protein
MAVALSAGVFAPRTVDAEEMPEELSVRVENPQRLWRRREALQRRLDWWTDGM